MRERSAAQAVALLQPLGIACAPVATYEEMLAADWKIRRGLTRVVHHPYLGRQEVFVAPWHFGGHTAGVALAAPLLGQHTAEVLGEVPPVEAGCALPHATSTLVK